jgi:hypothetical protein
MTGISSNAVIEATEIAARQANASARLRNALRFCRKVRVLT